MKSFPSKILLFGEYTLLYNQKAIAMPYYKYSGRWSFENNDGQNPSLQPWLKYIKQLRTNKSWISEQALSNFAFDLQLGIWFDSNIPLGYGLGSSGALVAAWYHRYIESTSKLRLDQLQSRMADLESYFHGTSSGFDPLVSYYNQVIFLNGKNRSSFAIVKSNTIFSNFFIVDTLQSRSTSPLVKYFKKRSEKSKFQSELLEPLMIAQEKAMNAFVKYNDTGKSSDYEEFQHAFDAISKLQGVYLKKLIPTSLQRIWRSEKVNQKYQLKICGAGGGGIMLGYGKLPSTKLPVSRLSSHLQE